MLRIDKRISEILQTALFILGPNGRKLACTKVWIKSYGSKLVSATQRHQNYSQLGNQHAF